QCSVPALPAGLAYVKIAAGFEHSLAIRSDGSVVAWGRNDRCQSNVPELGAGVEFVEVAAGLKHTLARRSDGTVALCGAVFQGWGPPLTSLPPIPAPYTCVEI